MGSLTVDSRNLTVSVLVKKELLFGICQDHDLKGVVAAENRLSDWLSGHFWLWPIHPQIIG
jgi:hypothetical protein